MLMVRRSAQRLTTTFFVVLSLLFSQLALASYVCPVQATPASMAEMMAAGVPCDGLDQQQPVLCHQHSADPGKTFEAAKLPVLSLPAIVQVLVVVSDLTASQADALPPTARSELRPPPDPLFLSTLRLRV